MEDHLIQPEKTQMITRNQFKSGLVIRRIADLNRGKETENSLPVFSKQKKLDNSISDR